MGWLKEVGSRLLDAPRLSGDAIRAHLEANTGSNDPFKFTFDDLAVLAYPVNEPVPHFLYATFGLSQVRSSKPMAGTQTELTLRVPREAPVPFARPAERLAAMVVLVRRSGNDIEPGHHLTFRDAPGGYLFAEDPVLGAIETPTGRVRFTQAVRVTDDEFDAALSWDTAKFIQVLRRRVPVGIGGGERESVLKEASIRKLIATATERDGSSLGAVDAKLLSVDATGRIDMDADAAHALIRAARHRLRHGHQFALVRNNTWMLIGPGLDFEADDEHIQIPATPELANEIIATMDAAPGVYRLTSAQVSVHVVGDS